MIYFNRISATKPIKPKITIEIASDAGSTVEPVPIVTATLSLSANDQSILVGYGDRDFLHFEQIVSCETPQKKLFGNKTSCFLSLFRSTRMPKRIKY